MARSTFAQFPWEVRLALVRSLIKSGYVSEQAAQEAIALGRPEFTAAQAAQLGTKVRAVILGRQLKAADADIVLLVQAVKKELGL